VSKFENKWWLNNIVLVLGLIFQSYIALSLKVEEGWDIIKWGLCAWMAVPYLILFLAHLRFNRTLSAQVTTTIAIYAIVIFSNFFYIMIDLSADALAGVAFLAIPFYGITLSLLTYAIAFALNR